MSAVATELGFVFRLMVGGLFLVWGISKARNLNAFRVAIRQYELLPAVAVAPAAVTFAALECVLGALLVLGATVSVAVMPQSQVMTREAPALRAASSPAGPKS